VDWQEHIRQAAYAWLLGERPPDCLPGNLLLLLGNPDLFQAPAVHAHFDTVEQVGVFRVGRCGQMDVAFTTPKFGAPVVAMYLEVAAMAKVRRVIAVGYAGGLAADVRVGDLFVPRRAVGEDGTTGAYFGAQYEVAGTAGLCATLESAAGEAGMGWSSGTIVSIDALMLESSAQIDEWHLRGYGAVDLETACVYALGAELGIECAALHIISDSPFRHDTDREARHMASLDDQLQLALRALAAAEEERR